MYVEKEILEKIIVLLQKENLNSTKRQIINNLTDLSVFKSKKSKDFIEKNMNSIFVKYCLSVDNLELYNFFEKELHEELRSTIFSKIFISDRAKTFNFKELAKSMLFKSAVNFGATNIFEYIYKNNKDRIFSLEKRFIFKEGFQESKLNINIINILLHDDDIKYMLENPSDVVELLWSMRNRVDLLEFVLRQDLIKLTNVNVTKFSNKCISSSDELVKKVVEDYFLSKFIKDDLIITEHVAVNKKSKKKL